jgi:predicted methyltransferase
MSIVRSIAALGVSFLAACAPAATSPAPAGPAPAPAATPAAGGVKVWDGAVPPHIRAAVDAADRTPDDRARDADRRPDKFLAFCDIKPGQKVAEVMAAGGYTTELLVRAVGPTGTVLGQNSPGMLKAFVRKPWTARLARPVNKNVQSLETELDQPFPAGSNLDLVVDVLFYHDLYWVGTDRAKMNKNIFDALKPGGAYVIVDQRAAKGAGTTVVKSLHRIEEEPIIADIKAAGFQLAERGSFMENPSDPRTSNAAPFATKAGAERVAIDRFVLKFVKPQ